MTRQVVLDTETTGLEPQNGHRIIEIGCVEVVNRKVTSRRFHVYVNPEREIDEGAVEVHGINLEDLADKPKFCDIAEEFLQFVDDSEVIIHNAPFDVGFLNMELQRCGLPVVESRCSIVDSLMYAREKHPGQKNSLDALCRRYEIDNSHRNLHGALLDAEILCDVYLAMTGGQGALAFDDQFSEQQAGKEYRLPEQRTPLNVIMAADKELEEHLAYMEMLDKTSGGKCVWKHVSQ